MPHFSREHRTDAIAMTLYRQTDLVQLVPNPLRAQVAEVNKTVGTAMVDLTQRRFGRADEDTLALVAVACQESGYGLIHRYLRHDLDIPPWMDDAVRASCTAILTLGDSERRSALPTRCGCCPVAPAQRGLPWGSRLGTSTGPALSSPPIELSSHHTGSWILSCVTMSPCRSPPTWSGN